MKKLLYATFVLAASVWGQGVTPNVGLNTPALASQLWNIPVNANFSKIDSIFGGSTPIPGLTVSGNTIVNNLTVTGSLTATGLVLPGTLVQTNTASLQTLIGPFSAIQMAGVFQADLAQTGGGNNGIANALLRCTNGISCMVLAPATYSLTEAQPWGGASFVSTGEQDKLFPIGPPSSAPLVAVMDSRYAVPQWMMNGSVALDNRHYASPTFVMNSTQAGQGRFSHFGDTLQLITAAYSGGRNMMETLGDKTNLTSFEVHQFKYTETQSQGVELLSSTVFGNGDGIGQMIDVICSGNLNTQHDEGCEAQRQHTGEDGRVFQGTITNISATADGGSVIQTGSQQDNGTQGDGRQALDLTQVYNAGYISAINNVGNTVQFIGSGTGWDSTFGVSSVTTLSTSISDNSGSVNLFPQSNVTVAVASTTGFNPSATVCLFDWDFECTRISSVTDSTHFVATKIYFPHQSGATVATGGLTGFAVEMEADRVDPANLKGIVPFADSPLTRLVRQAFPIMYNVTGETLTLFQPSGVPTGQFGGYSGRAWKTMGSGGTATATVAGSAVTAITCSGGSGYTSSQPPQLVFSGSWSTAPKGHVSSASAGAITVCTVDSPGTGVISATVAVVPYNPYDIYPQALVTNVFNPTLGTVDGTLTTQAPVGTFSVGDRVEVSHWFWSQNHGMTNSINQYGSSFNSSGVFGINYFFTGVHGGSDAAMHFVNNVTSCLYIGVSGCDNSILGNGQKSSPHGLELLGPWKTGIFMQGAPAGSAFGFQSGVAYVGCSPSCQTSTFAFLNSFNSLGGNDIIGYDQSREKWSIMAGATGNLGSNAAITMVLDGVASVLSVTGTSATISAPLLIATQKATLADVAVNQGFTSQVLGYNFDHPPTSTFDFGLKYATSGGLALAAFNQGFGNNGIGFFLSTATTSLLPDVQIQNNRGIAMRGDWKVIFCTGTDAGALNAVCTPSSVIGTPTSGNFYFGTGLGQADGAIHANNFQLGAVGFKVSGGTVLPGTCNNGDIFSLTSSPTPLNVCQSGAWVTK